MKTEQITSTEYTVRQKRVVEDYYTVKASSKAEAIRMVEEHEVFSEDGTETEKEYKPKVTAVTHYNTCPNVGEGWSDIPLSDLKKMEIGSFGWHYNGKCGVTKVTTESHCNECRGAMLRDRRPLTNEEKVYLNKAYSAKMNTEE